MADSREVLPVVNRFGNAVSSRPQGRNVQKSGSKIKECVVGRGRTRVAQGAARLQRAGTDYTRALEPRSVAVLPTTTRLSG